MGAGWLSLLLSVKRVALRRAIYLLPTWGRPKLLPAGPASSGVGAPRALPFAFAATISAAASGKISRRGKELGAAYCAASWYLAAHCRVSTFPRTEFCFVR